MMERSHSVESRGSFSSQSIGSASGSAGTGMSTPPNHRIEPQNIGLIKVLGINENLHLPLGFCLGIDDRVLVTDTDNHRVVVFDLCTARIDFSFGSYGTGNGQFVQPRKVTMLPQVVLSQADNPFYIICDRGTDRSRLQVFNTQGVFIRSIRIATVEIVSGLTATQDRKIVLVDSIRGDILVLSEFGDILFFFNCGIGVREPGDIAVHNNEYFVCDFQGHCICVFNQNGDMVRKIGQEHGGGLLNYPNGIDISNSGEVLVADSHGNQFHLNVFDADNGRLMGTFRCPNFKVSGCVGLKCSSDGHLLSLSKNNRRVLVLDPIQLIES